MSQTRSRCRSLQVTVVAVVLEALAAACGGSPVGNTGTAGSSGTAGMGGACTSGSAYAPAATFHVLHDKRM